MSDLDDAIDAAAVSPAELREALDAATGGKTAKIITPTPYKDGDSVPMLDGLYRAVGDSRPLSGGNPNFVTSLRKG